MPALPPPDESVKSNLDPLRQLLPEAMAKGVGQGLIGPFATALEPFALSQRTARGYMLDFASRGRAAAVLDDEEFNEFQQDVVKSPLPMALKGQFISGANALRAGTGTPEIFSQLIGQAPQEENIVTNAQAAMRAFIKNNLQIDPELRETLAVEVAIGAGSGLSFIATRFIPGIGLVSMGTFAALLGSGEAIQRAVEAGASNEQQARAGLLGIAPGLTDIVPIERLFKPFKRIKGFKGALYAIAQRMVSQGLIEGSQEGVQGFMQNSIARIHTSDTDLLEGIERQGLVGFIVGALFGGAGAIPRSTAVTPEYIRQGLLGYPTAADLINQQTSEFQTIPEIVGNIRIDKFDPAEIQNLIKERIQVAGALSSTALGEPSITLTEPEFAEAKRGGRDVEGTTVPVELTRKLAEEIGVDPAKLGPILEREFGQALNAEQIMAVRITLAQAGQDVFEKANTYRDNKTSQNKAQAVLALQRFEAILETLSGATAEAGRTLRILREPVSGEERAKATEQILKLVGTDKFDAALDMLQSLDTPGQIAELIETGRLTKAGPMDMLVEAYINSLLSGPQTHAVNVISNTVTAIGSVFETATSGILGKTVYIGAKNKVYLRETSSRAYGMIAGFGDGMVALGKVIWDENKASQLLKTEARFKQSIPSLTIIKQLPFNLGSFKIGGSTIRMPTRLLAAEDSFFKAIGYRMELQQLAKHEAIIRGLKGIEHRQFIRDFPKILKEINKAQQFAIREGVLNKKGQDLFILDSLKKSGLPLTQKQLSRYQDVDLQSTEAAHYQTFTKQLGRTGQAGLNFLNSHPALKFIVPFARTPTNIVKYAGERTPFSLFSPKVRAELIGRNGFYNSQRQQGKLVFGSSLMIWAGSLAAQGLLTGSGPEDPEEKASWYNTGEWQPNSIRFCKDCPWISYSRIEPLGIILGIAANFQQIASKLPQTTADELAVAISIAITDNLVSKTWLTGPAELALAINDPKRYGKSFMQRFIGSLVVPTGLAQIARVKDPVLREVNTIMDAIRRRLPWSAPNLEPNYRWDGEIISFQGSLGPDLISPLYKTERPEQPDVVNRELVSLGIGIKKPEPEIEGVKLLDLPGGSKLYSQYIVMAGKPAKKAIEALITVTRNGPAGNIWDIQTNEEKEKRIRKIVTKFREAARTIIIFSNKELFSALIKKKIDRATAIRAGEQLWPDETTKAIFGRD